MADPRIATWHAYPPIPIRTMDWAAYYDDLGADCSPYGWGRTEAEAIADLKENHPYEELISPTPRVVGHRPD